MSSREREVELTLATKRDAEVIHNLKREAFMPLYEKYHDDETNPAMEHLEETKRVLRQEYNQYWIIKYREENIGAIRICSEERGIYTVGPLFVVPEFQGKGIGTKAMELLFEIYEDAHLWKLELIVQEKAQRHLYGKLGFERAGYEFPINELMTVRGYEKRVYTDLLNEYDANPQAVVNPDSMFTEIMDEKRPKIAVMTYTRSIVDKWAQRPGVEIIGHTESANGCENIYSMSYGDSVIAFCMSPVGAPNAVATLENLVASGVETIVTFGSCGVMDKEIADGHLIIPTEAMRDEGTSYHYYKASDYIEMDEASVKVLQEVMDTFDYSYILGKTWTTDAIYRETREKVERRKKSGCIVVEMECSALLCAAKFRNIQFAQFLYAADNLDSDIWEQRGLTVHQGLSKSEMYMQIAFESGVRLNKLR